MTRPRHDTNDTPPQGRCRGRRPYAVTANCRSAFTLIEMLVVLGIILILMGLFFGIQRSMKKSALSARTRQLMQKIELAIEEYEAKFGTSWASALPDGEFGVSCDTKLVNETVTRVVLPYGDFTSTESSGQAIEVFVASDGTKYLVDAWYDINEGADALDNHMLRFARNRFNEPELDIWSTGPNGGDPDGGDESYYLEADSNADQVGDDIVNWGQ